MGEAHIDLVHIRPLLAIDLDTDEIFVEHGCHAYTLKALTLHHVTPCALELRI